MFNLKDFLQRPKLEEEWVGLIWSLSFWPQDHKLTWLQIEKTCCSPPSLSARLFSALPTAYSYSVNNPIVSHSFRIWSSMRKFFGWHAGSLRAPGIANHLFAPSLIQSFVSGSIKGFTPFGTFLLRINSHCSNSYELNLIYLARIILGFCSCEILSEKTSNPSPTYQIIHQWILYYH